MNNDNKTRVIKDLKEKSIFVSREFNLPLAKVWDAFTNSKLLDQWWAPAPWRCETKSMNFTPGGYWLYAMVSPENKKHWGRMNYNAINHQKNIEIEDAFCDENGNINRELPVSSGEIVFVELNNATRVEFKMTYPSQEDLMKITDMGFEQGITICFDQLDELLVTTERMA